MRDLIPVLAPTVASVVMVLVGVAAARLAAVLRARGAAAALASALEAVATAATTVVRSNEQTVVRDLKDPAKPGAWTTEAAAALKAAAVHDVRELAAAALAELRRRGMREATIEHLLEQSVERAVLEVRGAP